MATSDQFQKDCKRLIVLIRELVTKFLGWPFPDIRMQVIEMEAILARCGYKMEEAINAIHAKFLKEHLPPREFFTVICDRVEIALDELRIKGWASDEAIDRVYDHVSKGDLTSLMHDETLLITLLEALRSTDRTKWEIQWFFQFMVGVNEYRLALKEGPIPILEDKKCEDKAEEIIGLLEQADEETLDKLEKTVEKAIEETAEPPGEGTRDDEDDKDGNWNLGDPLPFGE